MAARSAGHDGNAHAPDGEVPNLEFLNALLLHFEQQGMRPAFVIIAGDLSTVFERGNVGCQPLKIAWR